MKVITLVIPDDVDTGPLVAVSLSARASGAIVELLSELLDTTDHASVYEEAVPCSGNVCGKISNMNGNEWRRTRKLFVAALAATLALTVAALVRMENPRPGR
ncbi:MAG TPA: hypothetical protein VFA32_12735 [Dehalococcoidia bacterium]|jgi:hypothetical protein|nr:hypothetical protein [Dehalococcoidia bacterium]